MRIQPEKHVFKKKNLLRKKKIFFFALWVCPACLCVVTTRIHLIKANVLYYNAGLAQQPIKWTTASEASLELLSRRVRGLGQLQCRPRAVCMYRAVQGCSEKERVKHRSDAPSYAMSASASAGLSLRFVFCCSSVVVN